MTRKNEFFKPAISSAAVLSILISVTGLLTGAVQDDTTAAISTGDDTGTVRGFSVAGLINYATTESDISIQLNHRFARGESAAFFAQAGLGQSWDAHGDVSVNLTVKGGLTDPNTLRLDGLVELNNCFLYHDDHPIAADANAMLALNGDRCDIEKVSATVFDGLVAGRGYAVNKAEGAMEIRGLLAGENLDLAGMSEFTGGVRKFKKGTGSFQLSFGSGDKETSPLHGSGEIFIDDADMTSFPILSGVFNIMGIGGFDPLSASDAEAAFDFNGPDITIKNAHIANRFGAIEVEPGGRLNLRTKQIDMNVSAVELRQLQRILEFVPVVNLFVELKRTLTRFKIRGSLDDPPASLITKQPITDVKDATLGFFSGVVKTGGQLTKRTFKTTRELIKPGSQEK